MNVLTAIPHYENRRFVHGVPPQDDLNRPYELQDIDSMDLSNENSRKSALLDKKILTHLVDQERITTPADLSKLQSYRPREFLLMNVIRPPTLSSSTARCDTTIGFSSFRQEELKVRWRGS